MFRFLSFILIGIVLAWSGSAHADEPPPYLVKDMSDLAMAMAGVWDNDRQVFFSEESGIDPSTIAGRQTLEIESPDADTPFHQRARSPGTLRSSSWFDIQYELDPGTGMVIQSYFAEADEAEKVVLCRIAWQRDAGGFSGKARAGDCSGIVQAGDLMPAQLTGAHLSAGDLWITTSGPGGPKTIKFRRAHLFSCWTAVLRGAHHGDSGDGMDSWYFRNDVELHDQGGEAVLLTDEVPSRQIRLKLRDVDWPYGTRRPSLTLYVYEGDDDRATSYAWTEGGGDRIGINLRWIQVSCTREVGE